MKKIILLLGILNTLVVANEISLDKSTITSTTGFTENISKENKNVIIIGKEDISKKEYHNLEEVLNNTPNVMVQQTYFGPIVDLRGNGERAISRVKVLVDGIAINPIDDSMGTLPINTIPLNNIERIEVIPGGGAVLNGSGTAGGVVNIITKSTEKKDYFSLNYGNSSYQTNQTSLSTGYNVTDKLYVYGGFSHLNGKGYRQKDSKENNSFNGGFEYQLTSNQKIRFQGSNFKENNDTSTSILKTELAKERKKAGYLVESNSSRKSYSLEYELKATDNLVFLTTLYTQKFKRNFTEHSKMDEYKMDKIGKMPFSLVGYNLPVKMLGSFDEDTKGIKLKSKYSYDKGNLILGYEYSKTNLKRTSDIFTNGKFFPAISKVNNKLMGINADIHIDILNDVYKENNSLFGLNKYNLSDNLSLITGLRYEHSKLGGNRVSNTYVDTSFMPTIKSNKNINSTDTENNFAGEIGLSYSYSDTGTVFTRYERGFISPMPGQITDKTQNGIYVPNNLKSETSDNFEVGIRDFVGNTYLSWTIFTSFTEDEITLIQGNTHNPATKWWSYKNLGKTRRLGTELLAEQYLGNLTLTQGITLINTKITKGEYKGDKVPLAPESKITLKALYQFNDNINAGLSFNYVGKSTIREYNKNDKSFVTNISSYHFTDLTIQYKFNENFIINAGINNIFNNKYNFSETKNYAIPAPERNYYIGGTISF